MGAALGTAAPQASPQTTNAIKPFNRAASSAPSPATTALPQPYVPRDLGGQYKPYNPPAPAAPAAVNRPPSPGLDYSKLGDYYKPPTPSDPAWSYKPKPAQPAGTGWSNGPLRGMPKPPSPSAPSPAGAASRVPNPGPSGWGKISPKAGAGIGAAAAAAGGAINAAQRIGAGQDAGSAIGAGAITAGGALAGGVAGAAVGGIVGGPLGAAIGGQLGGGLGGALGGALADKLYPLPEPTGGGALVPAPGANPGVWYAVTYVSGSWGAVDGPATVQLQGPIAVFIGPNGLGTPASVAGLIHGGGVLTVVSNGGYISSSATIDILSINRVDGQGDPVVPLPSYPPAPNYPAQPLPGSNPGPTPSPTAPAAPAPAPLLPPLPQPNLPGAPALDPNGVPRTDPAPQPQPSRPSLDPNGQPQQSGQTGGGTAGGGSAPAPGGSGLTGTGKASPLPTVDTKVVPRPGAFEGIPGAPALRPSPSPQPSRPSSPTTTTTVPSGDPLGLGLDPNGIPKILPGLAPKPSAPYPPGSGGGQNEPDPPPNYSGGACEIGSCGAANLQATQRVEGKLDTLLGGFNAGANSAQLAILNTIDAKLGPQIPNGGLGSFLLKMQDFAEKAWRATHLDKVINALTLIAALHNAAMLSRNLALTLGEVAGQALQLIGLKDGDGPIDVNEIVGNQIENLFKAILGEQAYNGIKTSWNRANRIISAATQIIWTVRSINASIREIIEWTANNVGTIGNALKRFRIVGQNAYPYMPENVKAKGKWFEKIDAYRARTDSLDDAASSFGGVLGEGIEAQEEMAELDDLWGKFDTSLKEAGLKTPIPNDATTERSVNEKAASQSADLNPGDTKKG